MGKSLVPKDVADAYRQVLDCRAQVERGKEILKDAREQLKATQRTYDELMGLAVEGLHQGQLDMGDPDLCPACEGCRRDAAGNPCPTCEGKGHMRNAEE